METERVDMGGSRGKRDRDIKKKVGVLELGTGRVR